MSTDVVIVGGGIAGLCCARRLVEAGVKPLVVEASDGVGGRVRTDEVEGFRIDRGFQVLLTAYPEARAVLDYDALDLHPFTPGALVRTAGRFERVTDPLRRPSRLLSTLRARVGTFGDKIRMARLRSAVRRGLGPETSTDEALHAFGFSDDIIEKLFRPWFGGVFLDRSLSASSRAFEFSFRMFSSGDTAVPAHGMGAIPEQLANALPEGTIRTGCPVESVSGTAVQLAGGETISARRVVVATEAPAAARLLGLDPPPPGRGVRTISFDAPEPPVREPILVLNGEGGGPVNDLCVMSEVSPGYAPAGRALVSVSVLDHVEDDGESMIAAVRAHLARWFGAAVDEWRHLKTVRIEHALPAQTPGVARLTAPDGVLLCGDHCDAASLQGAMVSGRRTADTIVREFAG